MFNSTQNITSLELAQLGIKALQKKKLKVEFDASTVSIYINNGYKPPISWFLTDETGEMVLFGQIAETDYTIGLHSLPLGLYSLRIAGEIHLIHND